MLGSYQKVVIFKIAVVDYGIDKTHEDLLDNISSISFNCETGVPPSVYVSGKIMEQWYVV